MNSRRLTEALSQDMVAALFPRGRQVLPNLSDVYELELAFYENLMLDQAGLLRNGAYFASVDGIPTRHFLMCTGSPLKLPEHSSSRLKSFFEKNIFRTGYGTHGLFPCRGKFHPQMAKGIINAMGMEPGETVLDPMMGSGTVPVEAALMGIHSIGIDASPFCRFMAQTKLDALTMSLTRAKRALGNYEEVFDYFKGRVGQPLTGSKTSMHTLAKGHMAVMESAAEYVTAKGRESLNGKDRETSDTYNFLLLAYLDSAGYSERSKRKPPLEQFRAILERYVFVAEKIKRVIKGVETELGMARVLEGDARALTLEDGSVDGIVFSPPYSFAVDYLANDSFHLNFLGVDADELRTRMVGLRGRRLEDKFELYKEDMGRVLAECGRVLRRGRICTIVVGTNSNQLSKVLDVSPEDVPGLHRILVELAAGHGLKLVKEMSRPITGISNTMRREYILLLQRQVAGY
jgi:DNA modification methylase